MALSLPADTSADSPSPIASYSTHHRGGLIALRFRPSMKHLVTAGADGIVLMWSLLFRPHLSRRTSIRPYRFAGHQVLLSAPFSLLRRLSRLAFAFSPASDSVAALPSPQGEVFAVAVSPLDNVVASASRDATVRLWLPTAEGKSTVIKAHSAAVRTIAFSPDGECLLTGSNDKTLKVWDVETEKFLVSLSGHMNWVKSAEFNGDGRLIVSGGDDKTIRVWDVQRHECIHQFGEITDMVNCTRFHPNGSCVASCGADQCIQIWDIRTKMLVQHYAGDAGAVKSLSFHPNGNFLLSTCDDSNLRIWDIREGHILYTLPGHEGVTTSAEFSPVGEHFASGSLDEHVMLWTSNLPNPCHCHTYSPENYDPSRQFLHASSFIYDPSRHSFHVSVENYNPSGISNHSSPDPSRQSFHGFENNKGQQNVSKIVSRKKPENHDRTMPQKKHPVFGSEYDHVEETQMAELPSANNIEDSSLKAKAIGETLEHLVIQVDVLTKAISLLGDRLSHVEDKVLHLEKEKKSLGVP